MRSDCCRSTEACLNAHLVALLEILRAAVQVWFEDVTCHQRRESPGVSSPRCTADRPAVIVCSENSLM